MVQVLSRQQAINHLVNCMWSHGGPGFAWYVGIASNPRTRLFNDHNVDEHADAWAWANTGSEYVARTVEKQIIDTHGTDGGSGGGDSDTTWVYCYKKTPTTNED